MRFLVRHFIVLAILTLITIGLMLAPSKVSSDWTNDVTPPTTHIRIICQTSSGTTINTIVDTAQNIYENGATCDNSATQAEITITCEDAESGCQQIYFNQNSTYATTCNNTHTAYTNPIIVYASSTGTQRINACSYDNAGNLGDSISSNPNFTSPPDDPVVFYFTYQISGTVYLDNDCSSTYNSGDTAFTGSAVTIQLYDSTGTTLLRSTTTSNGTYTFTDVQPESYTVRAVAPSGYQSPVTTLFSNPVVVTNANRTGINFFVGSYCISGTLSVDINDNSIYNSGTDTPLDVTATINITGTKTTSGNSNATNGTYLIGGLPAGSYTVTASVPADYQSVITPPLSVTITTASVTGQDFLVEGWRIAATSLVFIDYNNNGAFDAADGDEGFAGGTTVSLSGGYSSRSPVTTDANGNYKFVGLRGQTTYRVTLTDPSGYTSNYPTSLANPRNIPLGPDTRVDFSITPLFSLSTGIFEDYNKNERRGGGEPYYSATSQRIAIVRTSDNQQLASVDSTSWPYTFTNLLSGSYRVEYRGNLDNNQLPTGYQLTYPKSGLPASFTVTLGRPGKNPACSPGTASPDGTHDATCNANGDLSGVLFGISDRIPWFQGIGGDTRIDDGYTISIPNILYNNSPSTSRANLDGSEGTPGVIFSGDSSYNFCQGGNPSPCLERSSSTQWIVGGLTYPETFSGVNGIRTSYSNFQTTLTKYGITPTTLADVCTTTTGCSLNGLSAGVYNKTASTIYLNASTITTGNYMLHINGDVRIQGNIIVNNGATLTVIASGDIIIDKDVGTTILSALCNTATPTNCHVEGLYSADQDFIIEGLGPNDSCPLNIKDRKLNMNGTIIANASLTTGSYSMERDLCEDDYNYPAFTIAERPDFLLNAPELIKVEDTIWQEVAP